ncbi:tRNA (guanosine(46)-N(7))-methyltransferase TrmB [Bowmanella sp. JS7-9]|uniref:tRNA (guanine(46)-N(7))-methyltransferase n=1 Tax=Pseudobowmanella zhangzhouensis TaxID=1537679 RepID=A0ABW1XMQ2_9ALTE|nr:class I SAM-dependent methyltransferase [Bowmanella sp. JS7-9]TBX23761.1 SAM-dependent methlyltransferase [Bowmanella sp. JS7-9]
MSDGNSRWVTSNQQGPHPDVAKVVARHLAHPNQKPVSEHTLQAFEQAGEWLADWQGDLILDACCGIGESTHRLAKLHPHARVIGIDKSAHRLDKHTGHFGEAPANALLLRADVGDFWRLAKQANWQISQHYLLYPNPYPKKSQLQKRWHGHPAFVDLVALGGHLTVRSNWQTYIQEFANALQCLQVKSDISEYRDDEAFTPFERKYWASGQSSWQLQANLS